MINRKITLDQINYDFNKLKDIAIKLFNKNKIDESLKTIEVASDLMYNFNIKYADDDLENLIVRISKELFSKEKLIYKTICNDKKIIFYDYFSLDNRGLTQQYLRGLMDLNYEILYITYNSNNKYKSSNIIKELDDYGNAKIYYIKNKDYRKASVELLNEVLGFNCNKVMIHTTPSDMIGLVTFAYLENKIDRYLINITDHAFWLGKCSADYFIEFRSYGYNISEKYRGIDKNKLMILPYYPIQDYEIEFQGFPFDFKDKKLIFSGGSLYKIYGSDIFFNTVKYILDNYSDAIFLYVGNGDDQPLKEFIEHNGFKNRLFHINERKDITQIFKQCYFYLGTYPRAGGLMSQYAVANCKVPISYANKESTGDFIETVLIDNNNNDNDNFTYTDIKNYYEEIDKLISDPEYLRHRESQLEGLIISEKEFSNELFRTLYEGKTKYPSEKVEINQKIFYEMYLDLENNYLHNYSRIFVKQNYLKLGLAFPKYFLTGFYKKVRSRIKVYIGG